jgi:amino acid adenylation domain-containing protein
MKLDTPTKQIFDLSVDQIRLLARRLKKKDVVPGGGIQRLTKGANHYPLSFSQERLWFLDHLMSENQAYNLVRAFHIAELDVKTLERVLSQLEKRHEILRTTFPVIDGRPMQVVSSPSGVKVEVVDLRQQKEVEWEVTVKQLLTDMARQRFNLAQGPLWRCIVFHLGPAANVFALVTHHIIVDGWSQKIFMQEMLGRQLPELPIQYGDYAVWEHQYLQGETWNRLSSYWKGQLEGLTPLELPTDYARPPVQSFRGKACPLVLSGPVASGIRLLGRQEGVTPFMCLLAAFQVLLMRYTGNTDIAVAVPIANRNHIEVEGLIGLFVNTLVLRTNLSGNPSFRELLARVCEVCTQAYAHAEMPFQKLVEELQPQRDLSQNPFCGVSFQLDNTQFSEAASTTPNDDADHRLATPLDIDLGTSDFDLGLDLAEGWDSTLIDRSAASIRGVLTYSMDLFEEATIARMVGHYQRLLVAVVADREQGICDLPMLAESERQQVVMEWNETQVSYDRGKCIHELFEQHAEQIPNAVAVRFEDQTWTYGELNRRANQLANYLSKLGVGPEVRVAVCMERGLEMVVALLGVLKAGGAYVPLDPVLPSERLLYMVQDAETRVLLSQEKFQNCVPDYEGSKIELDRKWKLIEQESRSAPHSRVVAENLAYVIYTSGSTGKPKGVAVEHRQVCNQLFWAGSALSLVPADLVLQKGSFSFDASILEIFLPLARGAQIIVAKPEGERDADYLVRLVIEEAITYLDVVPPLLEQLLDHPMIKQWTSLRVVSCGGEVLKPELVRAFYKSLPGLLWNTYGPTESTVQSTFIACTESERNVSIGKPIANTQVYVLDSRLEPLPIGVVGELYIGGMGVTRGYLNRSELTAEKFVPNPFGRKTGERLYRTGDRARWRADGNIEFFGRVDEQVKIRGYRIELGEIEAVLNEHAGVRSAAVAAREDRLGDKRLMAYIVQREGRTPDANELRSHLRRKLPEYMVPSQFVMLAELPLTPNGKVDRRALPAPDQDLSIQHDFVAPRDRIELSLARIWEEVLSVRPVSIRSNFFEVGGNSLLSIRLMADIRKEFDYVLPITTLFQNRTLEDLATFLRREKKFTVQPALVPIQTRGAKRPIFLVYPAGTMCYYELSTQLASDQPVYGLEEPDLGEAEGNCPPIEIMADRYVGALQRVQPKGPYFLGGWSLGGVVAFEVARQLQDSGERVALLALIDTRAPVPTENTSSGADDFRENETITLGTLAARAGLDLSIPDVDLQMLGPEEQENLILSELKARRIVPPEVTQEYLRHLLKRLNGHARAVQNYVPRNYPDRIVLLRQTDPQPGATPEDVKAQTDLTLGWQRLTSEKVVVHQVAGNHFTMMRRPQAAVLAAILAPYLLESAGRSLAETGNLRDQ